MARHLYRLGRLAFRRKKSFLGAWLLLLVVLGSLAGAFMRSADAQLTIPGVESVTATELLQERFPSGGAGGASARIVFAAPDGEKVTDAAVKAQIESVVAAAGQAEQVVAV